MSYTSLGDTTGQNLIVLTSLLSRCIMLQLCGRFCGLECTITTSMELVP